jgi:hypothetical protein
MVSTHHYTAGERAGLLALCRNILTRGYRV